MKANRSRPLTPRGAGSLLQARSRGEGLRLSSAAAAWPCAGSTQLKTGASTMFAVRTARSDAGGDKARRSRQNQRAAGLCASTLGPAVALNAVLPVNRAGGRRMRCWVPARHQRVTRVTSARLSSPRRLAGSLPLTKWQHGRTCHCAGGGQCQRPARRCAPQIALMLYGVPASPSCAVWPPPGLAAGAVPGAARPRRAQQGARVLARRPWGLGRRWRGRAVGSKPRSTRAAPSPVRRCCSVGSRPLASTHMYTPDCWARHCGLGWRLRHKGYLRRKSAGARHIRARCSPQPPPLHPTRCSLLPAQHRAPAPLLHLGCHQLGAACMDAHARAPSCWSWRFAGQTKRCTAAAALA